MSPINHQIITASIANPHPPAQTTRPFSELTHFVKKGSIHRIRQLLNEIMIFKIVRRLPNIVECDGSSMNITYNPALDLSIEIYLHRYEMDLCKWRNSAFDRTLLPSIYSQIIEAVSALHSNRLAHLDLKPDNILISHTSNNDVSVRLCDFEHTCYVRTAQQIRNEIAITGTHFWNAPENNIPVRRDVCMGDIYSLGLVFLSLETGYVPWVLTFNRQTLTELCIFLYHQKNDASPDVNEINALRRVFRMFLRRPTTRGAIVDCIARMTDFDPDERPTIGYVRSAFAAANGMVWYFEFNYVT